MIKKNYRSIIIIFLFSILIMCPTINGVYISGHDTGFHSANISSIVKKISWSNILVREPLGHIANDFGYGSRFFYPGLPHLLAAYITKFITLFDVTDVFIGMRITQWLTFFLSGISFFLLGNKLFKDRKTSTLLSLFYMSFPYHLCEIFVRDAFSEMFIPISIPLITLGILYLMEDDLKHFYIYFIIGYTLAIYSHLAMSIYFTIITFMAFLIPYFKNIFNRKNIIAILKATGIILLLTIAFWGPLVENKLFGNYGVFTPYYMTAKGDLIYSAISPLELVRYDIGHNYDQLRYTIPLYLLIICLISIYYIVKNKMFKKNIIAILSFTVICIFMITKLFPWRHIPAFMETLQFPWRLVLYVGYGCVLLSGISLNELSKKKYFNFLYIALLLITGVSTYYYHNSTNFDEVNKTNIDYKYGLGNQKEYLPITTIRNIDYYNNRNNDIKVISGTGNITINKNDVPYLTFSVNNVDNLVIELPRIYYLGYRLKSNENIIKLEESDYGFVKAKINQNGFYELTYEGTPILIISQYISLITLIILIGYIIKKKYYNVNMM